MKNFTKEFEIELEKAINEKDEFKIKDLILQTAKKYHKLDDEERLIYQDAMSTLQDLGWSLRYETDKGVILSKDYLIEIGDEDKE